MPYDYIKAILVPRDIPVLIANPDLDFKCEVSHNTGDVKEYPLQAEYGQMKIKIYSQYFGVIQGSVHKYYEGGTNYDDFTLREFKGVIEKLRNELGIDLYEAGITNLEVGLNIKLKLLTHMK